MHYELSQRFFFDAAHTLRREIEAQGSKRVHGHTYQVEVTISGAPDPQTGMILDLGILRARLAQVKLQLDHHLLDEVEGLGIPTLENLCAYLMRELSSLPAPVHSVAVWRDGIGDKCVLRS
jgi:6-pyruvoyltetrahydropterin/6-carboxytetrahydropterin synthase